MSRAGDIPQSLRVPQMAPLDDKNHVNLISELTDLGPNNSKVFTYYRGMIIYCHENKKRYEWTDLLEDAEGLLDQNFKYPRGIFYDGTNYSNLEFNFIEYNIPEHNLIISETNSEFESYIQKSKAKPGQIVFNKEDGVYYSIILNSGVLEYEPFSPLLEYSIKSDVSIGAIEVGQTLPEGMTFTEFVSAAIEKTFFPTFTAPTFSLSNNAGTREIGETINLVLTGTFNRGAINLTLGNGVTTKQSDRSGVVNEYVIDNTPSLGNTKTITGYKVKSSNSFSATANYVQGPQPKDSKGNNFQSPLAAGALNATTSFTANYKRFFGPSDGNTAPRSLPSNAFDNAPTTFNLVTGTTHRMFDLYIPNNRILTEVLDLDALNANITANYVLQGTVQVADAGGDMVTYKHYRMTNDIPYGESHRHQIKL